MDTPNLTLNGVGIRPARIGDHGVLLPRVHRHGSIGTLVLQLDPREQGFLYGDLGMVSRLAEELGGQPVEVIEGDGSSYGAHDLRPLPSALPASTTPARRVGVSAKKVPVRLQRMPDGSFCLSGLGKGGRVHLRRQMRSWSRQDCPQSGQTLYFSRSRREAEAYARAHGLTIEPPCQS